MRTKQTFVTLLDHTLKVVEPCVLGVENTPVLRKINYAEQSLNRPQRAIGHLASACADTTHELKRVISHEILGYSVQSYTAPVVISDHQPLGTFSKTREGFVCVNTKQALNVDADGDTVALIGRYQDEFNGKAAAIKWPLIDRVPILTRAPKEPERWDDVDQSPQLLDKNGKPLLDWSADAFKAGKWVKEDWITFFKKNHTDSGVGLATVNVSNYAIHMVSLMTGSVRRQLSIEEKRSMLDGFGYRYTIEEGLKAIRGHSVAIQTKNNYADRDEFYAHFKRHEKFKFNPTVVYTVRPELGMWLTTGGAVHPETLLHTPLEKIQETFFNLRTATGYYVPKPSEKKPSLKIQHNRANHLGSRLVKLGAINIETHPHQDPNLGHFAIITFRNRAGQEIGNISRKEQQSEIQYRFMVLPGFVWNGNDFTKLDVLGLLNWQLSRVWLSAEERETFGTTWESLEENPAKVSILMSRISELSGKFGFSWTGKKGVIPRNTFMVAASSLFVDWGTKDLDEMAERAWKLYCYYIKDCNERKGDYHLCLLSGDRGSADSLQMYRIGKARSGKCLLTAEGADDHRVQQLSSQTRNSHHCGKVRFAVVGKNGTDSQLFALPSGVKKQLLPDSAYLPKIVHPDSEELYNPNNFITETQVPSLTGVETIFTMSGKTTRHVGKLIVPTMGLKGTLTEVDWEVTDNDGNPIEADFVISEQELRAKGCMNAALKKKVAEGYIRTESNHSKIFIFEVDAARTLADSEVPGWSRRIYRGFSSHMVADALTRLGDKELTREAREAIRHLLKERNNTKKLRKNLKSILADLESQIEAEREAIVQVERFKQEYMQNVEINDQETLDDLLQKKVDLETEIETLNTKIDDINKAVHTTIEIHGQIWTGSTLPTKGFPRIKDETAQYIADLRNLIRDLESLMDVLKYQLPTEDDYSSGQY